MQRSRLLTHASTGAPAAVRERQVAFNRSTAANWNHFTTHRRRVTELVLSAQPRGPLCVFGAGNCNDLDLHQLVAEFSEVHLVDLDGEALANGIERQGLSGGGQLRLHPGVDLSGVADSLDAYRVRRSDLALNALIERVRAGPRLDLGASFGVVASTAVLTQLLNAAMAVIGYGHPRLDEVFGALRTAHVRLLAETLQPGGTGILITDVASSEICAGLAGVPHSALPELTARLEQEDGFFAGISPAHIEAQLRSDPYLSTKIEQVRRIEPWQWQIGSKTTYLVLAFLFRKKGPGPV